MDDIYDLVSQRAYHLWEAEGRPHGQDQRHWDQAWREIEAERLEAEAEAARQAERPALRRVVLRARYSPANRDVRAQRRAAI
ncbi:Protein of unknown function [Rhizobium sp. RU20A]|uniref:DUF2934 domain-containing protein n=1 Tax=Rhizobium sp. RU20A TaxID=1907412 RepID=UPI000954461D|nr:DUF2934 domain-containing protein [Rhizobium sp. RU20A]SIR45715.1 Protein of unknown function [Rhizobium sp. RU20A]